MNKELPINLRTKFKSWEEYRLWSIHQAKKELMKAFSNPKENFNKG